MQSPVARAHEVLPLLGHARRDATIAFRKGRRITVDEFLREVDAVAEALPRTRYVANLCNDRYRFAVGFAATLVREQASLLLPNKTPGLIAEIAARYPELCFLAEGDFRHAALPVVTYPEKIPDRTPPSASLGFPATQLAAIAFTSGSTGAPMPAAKSWGSLVRSTRATGASLGIAELADAVLLGTVPPQHMYGLESTVLLALQHGLALDAGRPFYPGDIRAALAALPRPRMLVTTPIHLRALMMDGAPAPACDFVLSATAPLAPQLASWSETNLAAPLYEIYGCSEAGQVAVRRTAASDEWHCIAGMRLRQDERGIWVGGDIVAAEVLLNDVIELRDAERFLLFGRTADLVNVAGKRTSLGHLNYHLNAIPGVIDGAFVMPEEKGDAVARLTAFVVAPGVKSTTIIAALRQRIDAVFLPRPLHFVDALPRDATGKLPQEAARRLLAATRAG